MHLAPPLSSSPLSNCRMTFSPRQVAKRTSSRISSPESNSGTKGAKGKCAAVDSPVENLDGSQRFGKRKRLTFSGRDDSDNNDNSFCERYDNIENALDVET